MKNSFVFMLIAVLMLVGGGQTSAQDAPLMRGTLIHDGLTREYLLYVPDTLADPAPLLIGLHGGSGDALGFVAVTERDFHPIADREGFMVVYPSAYERRWNDGRGPDNDVPPPDDINDVGFISALIDHLAEQYPIDLNRVYVTGMSGGGAMTYKLACELTDRLAAVAPVAFTLPAWQAERCQPTRPIPIMIIHGTADPIVPFEGGQVELFRSDAGQVLSFEDNTAFWLGNNGCELNAPTIERLPDIDPDDDSWVRRVTYPTCAVTLYTVEGGGHTWPGGLDRRNDRRSGATNHDLEAAEAVWAFVSQHTLPTAP